MQSSPVSESQALIVLLCFARLYWYESASSLYDCFFPKYIQNLLPGPPKALSVFSYTRLRHRGFLFTFKGCWPFTSVCLDTFSCFSIPNTASDHPTTVRQRRLCSRPTRQQINRPGRSCWNCSGTLHNCRAANVGHLPHCLFFLFSVFLFLFIRNICRCCTLILILLLVNSGEAGEVRPCGRPLRVIHTLIWWLQF